LATILGGSQIHSEPETHESSGDSIGCNDAIGSIHLRTNTGEDGQRGRRVLLHHDQDESCGA
jgi:hypothetical protein